LRFEAQRFRQFDLIDRFDRNVEPDIHGHTSSAEGQRGTQTQPATRPENATDQGVGKQAGQPSYDTSARHIKKGDAVPLTSRANRGTQTQTTPCRSIMTHTGFSRAQSAPRFAHHDSPKRLEIEVYHLAKLQATIFSGTFFPPNF
jgi:hypothetical protein